MSTPRDSAVLVGKYRNERLTKEKMYGCKSLYKVPTAATSDPLSKLLYVGMCISRIVVPVPPKACGVCVSVTSDMCSC